MLYAIMATDVDDSLERRKAARPNHLARLDRLADEGRLLLAGLAGRRRALCRRGNRHH